MVTSDKRLRVAIVGAGYWGPNLLRNFTFSADWEVAWLVDVDQAKLDKQRQGFPSLACTTSLKTALDDASVDAIAVATPVSTHYEVGLQSLRAGKHILIEKPLADSLAHAKELCDVASGRKLTVFCDHTFLYSGAFDALYAAVSDRNSFGQILYMDSMRVNRDIRKPTANVIIELAPHDISIMNKLVGEYPSEVSTTEVRRTFKEEADVAFMTLRYPSGVVGHVHLSWVSPVKVRRLMVAGMNRMAIWDDLETEKVRIYDMGIQNAPGDPNANRILRLTSSRTGAMYAPAIDPTETLEKVVSAFATAVRGGPSRSTAEDGLAVMRAMHASLESIRGGGAFVAA